MNIEKLLLTEEEGTAVVDAVAPLGSVARLCLDRGHWEDAIEIIARAQIEKMVREGVVMLAKNQKWPEDPVTEAMVDDIETGDIYAAQSNGWQHCQSAAIAVGFRRVEDIE